ncbi:MULTISPECIES: septum site-determining protein MinC [unclassified Hydrogenobaculum]|uniref:septum site-determining protein MinC n=1 Tax=unclassified Hydrogenobaculum TaxID=2622382 RepID=UPI0001C50A68|nr:MULTISPECIES: septum site-determining protein MinC [unclassified Hydrogenobaculum]AEF19714.1 septum site-determining protein MinC [Hydrogenobaculum sp. 3684]AEG47001.1 septum site-determining protein minC [Hydrogenobaculum sp. SHO]AGG15649.1 septum site-determining protein MinC [Hydrogenobaculum sp. HO]AGH93948.1 septum site-determining protein MinC [Hydrogenobaculum sp. SN]
MIKIKGITLPVVSLTLSLEDTTKENLINELVEKINSNVFSNSYFLIEVDESIDKETLKQIEKLLEEKNVKSIKTMSVQTVSAQKPTNVSRLLIVNKNLRSGQTVEHSGDVLILGDVNEGAEVVAAGNIVVMGTLRGYAHAGAIGDDSSVVVAKKMMPQQLRIGHHIAIRGEDEEEPQEAEIAKVIDNKIILEPIGGF